MQRILYEISSSNYYPAEFQDIWYFYTAHVHAYVYACAYAYVAVKIRLNEQLFHERVLDMRW